jgi:hypothetical protein
MRSSSVTPEWPLSAAPNADDNIGIPFDMGFVGSARLLSRRLMLVLLPDDAALAWVVLAANGATPESTTGANLRTEGSTTGRLNADWCATTTWAPTISCSVSMARLSSESHPASNSHELCGAELTMALDTPGSTGNGDETDRHRHSEISTSSSEAIFERRSAQIYVALMNVPKNEFQCSTLKHTGKCARKRRIEST